MKVARKINALSKKTFFTKCYFRIPCHLIRTYELQHSLMFIKWPVFLLNPSGNLHRKQMLSSSMLTVFTFEQCRNNQFSTSPGKHGKNPGSLTGLKKQVPQYFSNVWIEILFTNGSRQSFAKPPILKLNLHNSAVFGLWQIFRRDLHENVTF